MLDGVPLPPGFDPAALETESHLTYRFELGQASPARSPAAGSKAGRGDSLRGRRHRRAAVEGMSGARRWPVLLQMVREKGFRATSCRPTATAGRRTSSLRPAKSPPGTYAACLP